MRPVLSISYRMLKRIIEIYTLRFYTHLHKRFVSREYANYFPLLIEIFIKKETREIKFTFDEDLILSIIVYNIYR